MELDRTERRVIGALIEKRWATPEQYPLTLNYLLGAANQKSNRDPVMDLHDFEVEGVLLSLREKGHVLVRERDGGRVTRYAEKFTDDLHLSPQEASILAELLLRGPQSIPELARRATRMARFEGVPQAETAMRGLAEKHLVRIMPKESGKRHQRWDHRLYPEGEQPEVPEAVEAPLFSPPPAAPPAARPDELALLRAEIEDLKRRVEELEGGREKGSDPCSQSSRNSSSDSCQPMSGEV